MKYCLYIQRRDGLNETWEETNRPEPYNVYNTLPEARAEKYQLEDKSDHYVRWFIKKITPEQAQRYLGY
jgi:hypothetical protein